MNKELALSLVKNMHRVILIGFFASLSCTLIFMGNISVGIEDWLRDKLPVFGSEKDS